MKRTFKINRNQFMKGLIGAGILSFFPFFSTNNDKHSLSQKSPVDKIIEDMELRRIDDIDTEPVVL